MLVRSCWSPLFEALRGGGSIAPSLGGLKLDGSPVPLGSTATHDPVRVPKPVWARWRSLEATTNPGVPGMTLQGQTVLEEKEGRRQ